MDRPKAPCSLSTSEPLVYVVLSAYNGETTIGDQLESVLGQTYRNLRVLVRDDGSADDTARCVERMCAQDCRLELIRGENVGIVPSFLELVRMVAGRADYVAFCDQDDVWHSDKVARAVNVLERQNPRVPQLYCSEYTFCHEDMSQIGKSNLNRVGISYSTMLYESVCSGNTMLMNRELVRRVALSDPGRVYTHDWWVASIAAFLGQVHFDQESTLEYRRSEGAASPTGASSLFLLRYRIEKFVRGGDFARIREQNAYLLECFGDEMGEEQRRVLYAFTKAPGLLKAVYPRRMRQRLSDELALRLALLMGL